MATRLFTILFFLTIGMAASEAGASAPVRVEVRENSVVTADLVFLGDIAELSGDPATVERLSQAPFGYSPRVGAIRTITLRKINLVIAATGISRSDFKVISPAAVYVRRLGQPVSADLVRNKIEASLDGLFTKEHVDVEIVRLDIPDAGEVPTGSISIEARFSNIRNLFEPFSLPIEIRVDSRLVSRISATMEIIAYANVFSAAADIPANTRISKAQLVPQRIRLNRPLTEYLQATADLRGIGSTQEIRKGDPLTKSNIVLAVVIKNGDNVRIVGKSGRLRLVVNGIAEASGRIGDRIAVRNLQSNRVLQGTIADEGIVEVFF